MVNSNRSVTTQQRKLTFPLDAEPFIPSHFFSPGVWIPDGDGSVVQLQVPTSVTDVFGYGGTAISANASPQVGQSSTKSALPCGWGTSCTCARCLPSQSLLSITSQRAGELDATGDSCVLTFLLGNDCRRIKATTDAPLRTAVAVARHQFGIKPDKYEV